jgi:hypothetical protein
MIEKTFNDSKVYICEDTARVIVYNPSPENKMDIIDFIDKSNFTCAAVFTEHASVARTYQYYFNCSVTNNMRDIKKIEESFS